MSMPPKKVPTSTSNAYAALDDLDLDSLIKKEDLDKIVLDHAADKEEMTANLKETRSGLDDLHQKFNNLVELQEGNSETLKGLSTAVTSLARLLEAKTGDTGDGWSQPTESPAGSVHSETASFQTAMPVPVRYSADATLIWSADWYAAPFRYSPIKGIQNPVSGVSFLNLYNSSHTKVSSHTCHPLHSGHTVHYLHTLGTFSRV